MEIARGISRVHFSIVARGERRRRTHPAGPLHAQRDADVNACPRYDIYFIGVSLPSSMMIYNCCSLGCNYYNYRFFVRGPRNRAPAWPGPGRPLRSIPLDAAPPLWSFISRVSRPPSPLCISSALALPIGLAPLLTVPLARRSFYLANRDQIYGGSDVETGFGSWTRAMSSPRARLLRNLCLCFRLRFTLNAGRSIPITIDAGR